MTYQEVQTKKEYIKLVNLMIEETKTLEMKFPSIGVYNTILEQLNDILNQIDNKKHFSENEIYERYSLGSIAVKDFNSETDLYGRRLEDVFGALFEYWDLPND